MPNDFDELQEPGFRKMEDYWRIIVRQRWMILAPVFLCWVALWSVSWLLPSHYQSDAVIQVEQQKVPEHFVLPNVTLDLSERVQSMTQQILSRTRLQTTIDRFHLYPPVHGVKLLLQFGDPIEQMRKDIKVEVVQNTNAGGPRSGQPTAFKISYKATSPELAQQVNSELTSLFITENLTSQRQLSEKTTAFLSVQLEDARSKLEEQENKLRAFKAKHLGDLPSQLESNVQILSGLGNQLQSTQHALDAAKQERIYLESLVQQYQNFAASGASENSSEALNKDLVALRVNLADARSKYSDDHPDVIALKDKIKKIEALKKQQDEDFTSAQKTSASLDATSKSENNPNATSTPVMQMQSKLKSNRLEIENFQKQQKSLESEISSYRARLNLTPATEQELADVSRGYEESKTNYNSLLQKQNQSQLATSLEQRQQGEQFSILDPPTLPDRPSDPNHLLVSLSGLGIGLVIAASLVFLREFINARVQSESDLECVPAKLLVAIPRLSTPAENRVQIVRSWIERGTVAVIAILIVAGNLYAFYKG